VEKSVVDPQVLVESRNQLAIAKAKRKAAEAGAAPAKADIKIKAGKLLNAKASLEAARAAVGSAQSSMDKARIQESFTQLKAAFDGVVTRRTADAGNFVQPSDSRLHVPLLTVQSVNPVRLVVQLPSECVRRLSLGDPVEMTFDSLPGLRIRGLKVTRFSPILDSTKRTMRVEIDVPNADGRILPGMSGKATIHFKKILEGAVVVPASCLAPNPGEDALDLSNPWVFVVRDGKAHRTRVTLGEHDEDEMEIVQGIQASDLLVADPKDLKGDVVPVEIKKAP
jgi:RND family efflux transporter MFP subunit